MHVLEEHWRDGYLDYHRAPGELRVQVRAWWPLAALHDVFVGQPRSVRRVWNYFREFGPRELLLKVRSGLGETLRDRRCFCIGAGEVLETDAEAERAVTAADAPGVVKTAACTKPGR